MYDHEEMKKKLYEEAAKIQAGKCGATPCETTAAFDPYDKEPRREALRERVWTGVRRAERESRKAQQLAELAILLDKNPEVARILELIEDVRV